jgi:hypothetical protein
VDEDGMNDVTKYREKEEGEKRRNEEVEKWNMAKPRGPSLH